MSSRRTIPPYTRRDYSTAHATTALDFPVAAGPGRDRARARHRAGRDEALSSATGWFCDPTVALSRQPRASPDTILQGWTYRTEAARPLHRYYHHGSFAEQMLTPTENVTPIGDIDAADAGRWTALGRLLVPFGGLLAGDLQAGETLVVNGATGGFGGAGVAVALAMGAGTVVATGRNEAALDDMVRLLGSRVAPRG